MGVSHSVSRRELSAYVAKSQDANGLMFTAWLLAANRSDREASQSSGEEATRALRRSIGWRLLLGRMCGDPLLCVGS